VTFTDNGSSIGTVTLSGGIAQLTTSILTVSTHPIVASYSGDAKNLSSVSTELDQVVNTEGTTTQLTSDFPSGSNYGQSVTFTATVSSNSPGVAPPNGFISFTDSSGDILASVPVADGTAAFSTASVADSEDSILPVGNNTITATFTPTNSVQASSSAQFVQTVNPYTPTVTDVINDGAGQPPYVAGQPVQFTATIAGFSGGPTPTGTVTWSDGQGDTFGPVTLSGGNATVTGSFATAGNYAVIATYTPDSGSPSYTGASDSGTGGIAITIS
jgi:hypothetical protein